jgi:hypothetical protein
MRCFLCFFLFTNLAFAQTYTRETYVHRENVNPDHPWANYKDSERFTIWFSGNASDCGDLTEAQATTALSELEHIFDIFVTREGFPPPYADNATKYKMGAWVLRCNEGHAFGGTIGTPRMPGMWLAKGAVSDKWALAHEFMHGLAAMTGGMSGGSTNQGTNFTGWFHESHANLTPHLVYPSEMHYCAEMYTRTAQLYLGSTRNRYCNWQFFEYLIHKGGAGYVNDIWTRNNPPGSDPFTEIMRINNVSQSEFGDLFGDFAIKSVIWDINAGSVHPVAEYANRGSAFFRAAFNKSLGNPDERFKRPRYTYLEALDGENAADNRYVSPFATSPQRYGYNIIRLYPDIATGTVTVRFRGDVQTQNNMPSYEKKLNLEPAAANLPDNPGSDWRYGLVAVKGNAQAASGTVTARYSELMRFSDGYPDVSITLQSGEEQLYLVVAATPAIHHKISWDQFYYTIYRFPYMVEINGAKPEGFQAKSNTGFSQHSNGGGWVQTPSRVAATAYVGPNARVEGTSAQVQGNARIEGRAVVKGGTVSGNAIVKDYAMVAGGTITDRAIISEGANIFNGQISGDAKVHGAANIVNSGVRISGNAEVGGVVLLDAATILSGTAQLLGDGEVYGISASSGVYYGLVDDGVIGSNQHGANRTEPPVEVTKPRSLTWYGDNPDPGETNIFAAMPRAQFFNLNNKGIFSYNLGEASSANLKIFNSSGKLLKSIPLSGAQGSVDIQINSRQILFWKVELPSGRFVGKAFPHI